MQTIQKFMQGLASVLALAIPVAVSAAPVTLRFAGEVQVAWPGAPVGTPFVIAYSFDSAQLVDIAPAASVGQYVAPGGGFFGTVSFTAGSLVLTGALTTIFVEDAAPGQDDRIEIYGGIDDANNNSAFAWLQATGKDWLGSASLPLNAVSFDGASSLVYSTGIQSPEPNPYQDFTTRARAIPEPGSLALVCLALASVASSRRGHRPAQAGHHRD